MTEALQQLQLLEQNLQQFLQQKQQYQQQMMEAEQALKEVKGSEECYKMVGNVLVLAKQGELTTELEEKKIQFEKRIATLDKQEARLKERMKDLQEQAANDSE